MWVRSSVILGQAASPQKTAGAGIDENCMLHKLKESWLAFSTDEGYAGPDKEALGSPKYFHIHTGFTNHFLSFLFLLSPLPPPPPTHPPIFVYILTFSILSAIYTD